MFHEEKAAPSRLKRWFRNHWYDMVGSLMVLLIFAVVSGALASLLAWTQGLGFITAFAWFMLAFLVGYGVVKVYQRRKTRPPKLLRRKRENELAEPAPVEQPPYIPFAEVHEITRKYSGLFGVQLQQVYYDEPHHWIVTLAMVFNPFWGRDHDVQPDMSSDLKEKLESSTDESLVSLLKFVVAMAKILHHTVLAAGVMLLAVYIGLHNYLEWLSLWMPLALITLSILATIPWVLYIRRSAQGCRLVITKDVLCVVVHQLPWRTDTVAPIPRQNFNAHVPQQTLLGRLVGSGDVLLRTKEQEEVQPAWIRGRNLAKLNAALKYWAWQQSEYFLPADQNAQPVNPPAPKRERKEEESTHDTQPLPIAGECIVPVIREAPGHNFFH